MERCSSWWLWHRIGRMMSNWILVLLPNVIVAFYISIYLLSTQGEHRLSHIWNPNNRKTSVKKSARTKWHRWTSLIFTISDIFPATLGKRHIHGILITMTGGVNIANVLWIIFFPLQKQHKGFKLCKAAMSNLIHFLHPVTHILTYPSYQPLSNWFRNSWNHKR